MVGLTKGLGCKCCGDQDQDPEDPWPPDFCTWYIGGDHDETFDPPYSRQEILLREGWDYPIDPSSNFSNSWKHPGQLTLASPFLATLCPNRFLRPPLIYQAFFWKWHLQYHGFEYSFTYNLPTTALPVSKELYEPFCVANALRSGDIGMVLNASVGGSNSNGVNIRHVYENDFINPPRWRVFVSAFTTTRVFVELPLKTQYDIVVRNYRALPSNEIPQELYIDGVLTAANLRYQNSVDGACPGEIWFNSSVLDKGVWVGDPSRDMHIRDFKFRII
jgi:hypothetical protein